jgi:DNA replication and repair protein RecF
MYVRSLSLADFRSYAVADVALGRGVTTIIGPNGQGKTNLVEAIGYVATLASHRVATDQPLVRLGAQQALIRAVVVRHDRETLVELALTPGRANRARLNRAPVQRPRDVLGSLRSVLFAPEDLALVKGDPAGRRAFLDDLLVARQPRWAGVRADYERVLKQRNALLKSAAPLLRPGARRRRPEAEAQAEATASALHTLDVWNTHLARLGAELLHGRLQLVRDLAPYLGAAYESVSAAGTLAVLSYRASLREAASVSIAGGEVPALHALHDEFHASFEQVRAQEVERGVSLVGPHRDELSLSLGPMPAKGYASQGESWSLALGLKLAAYQLLRDDLGEDPVLVLDDVFSELDSGRRERLAALVAGCEQVIVTAAVEADVPESLRSIGVTYAVSLGEVDRVA